jgi:hypothetical protein
MYDRSDGCLLILLSLGGSLLLTLLLFTTVIGDSPPGTHRGPPTGLALAGGGSALAGLG